MPKKASVIICKTELWEASTTWDNGYQTVPHNAWLTHRGAARCSWQPLLPNSLKHCLLILHTVLQGHLSLLLFRLCPFWIVQVQDLTWNLTWFKTAVPVRAGKKSNMIIVNLGSTALGPEVTPNNCINRHHFLLHYLANVLGLDFSLQSPSFLIFREKKIIVFCPFRTGIVSLTKWFKLARNCSYVCLQMNLLPYLTQSFLYCICWHARFSLL